MSTFVLANDSLRLEFDRDSGALVHAAAADGTWQILDRPQLGLAFRLLVPLPGRRNNNVLGEKQRLTNLELDPGGRRACFAWEGVTSELGGPLDIGVTLDVQLTERQAVFTVTVANRSAYVVENVYCPYLGDVQHPPQAEWLKTFVYNYAAAQEWPALAAVPKHARLLRRRLPHAGLGLERRCGCANGARIILLRSAQQGLYVGVNTPSSELVAWHPSCVRAGASRSTPSSRGRAPSRDRTWPCASPPCMCPTSSPAKPAP